MKKIDRKITLFLILTFCSTLIYAQTTNVAKNILAAYNILPEDSDIQPTFEELLEGYTSDNTNIQKLEVVLQKAMLDLERAYLKVSPNVNLSTGTVSATLSSDNVTYSAKPTAKVTLPTIANSEITGEIPLTLTTKDGNKEKFSISGSGISASVDIISSAKKSQDVTVQKALRAVTEAERKLEAEKLNQKKAFLTEIKDLYTKASDLISAKDALYDKELDLQSLQAKGYEKTSSTYRTAAIGANNAKHTILVKQREYENSLRSFAKSCKTALTALPTSIPDETLISAKDFNKGDYTSLENSYWNHEINEQSRNAQTDFTLKANGGYKYTEKETGKETTKNHNVTAGVSATYNGLNMGAGVSVPVNDIKNPTFSLSLGWDLNTTKSTKIDKAQEELDVKTEMLNIKAADESYAKAIENAESEREDLLWYKNQYEEDVELYADFLKETTDWYKKGLIPQSQVTSAQRNYTNAVVKEITGRLNRLIYNINTRTLFVTESE